MTDETKTKQYIVVIEAIDVLIDGALHELLCTLVHEHGDAAETARRHLYEVVTNIQVVGVIEQTG